MSSTPEPDLSSVHRFNDLLCRPSQNRATHRIGISPTPDDFCRRYHATRTAKANNPTSVARAKTRLAIALRCDAPVGIVVPGSTPSPVSEECEAYRATEQAILRHNRFPENPPQKRYQCRSGPWWFRLLCAGYTYQNDK